MSESRVQSLATRWLSDHLSSKGLTTTELGAKLGVTRQAVEFWLRGDGKPSFEMMVRLRDEYFLPLDWWTITK